VTTQPEFSFFFDDVGWGLENYGTNPDVEVDNAPQDYRCGFDAQLERAIEVCLERLAANPPHAPRPTERHKLLGAALSPRALTEPDSLTGAPVSGGRKRRR
jgi:tricorn protease